MLSTQAFAMRLSPAARAAFGPVTTRSLSSIAASTAQQSPMDISQHRGRRNSFSLNMKLAHAGESFRRNSSSAPPASSNKKIMPTSTRLFEKTSVPKEMTKEGM